MSLTENYGREFRKRGGIHGSSQASTFIESVFEEKCLTQISEGDALLNEWRIRKAKYIDMGRGTAFDFLHYSRHDASHSVNILNSIEMVLGKQRIRKLSTSDLWLLLECAYYHDLAMSVSYLELRNLWQKDKDFKKYCKSIVHDKDPDVREAASFIHEIGERLKKDANLKHNNGKESHFMDAWPLELQKNIMVLTGEYLRRKHASAAKNGLRRVLHDVQEITPGKTAVASNSVIKKRLNQLVESVSALHGEDFPKIEEELPQKARAFSTENVHPQFIAALLRLGDLLDMDNNRFDPMSLRRFGSLPHVSRLHYEKHEAITHFVIDTHSIEAKAYSDDYEVCQTVSDWFRQLEGEVNNLICAWNRFAPRKLRGCTLARCDLKVYYKEELFDTTKQKCFEVDKNKMLELVIGSNVYDSKLDCLREYVQNAMDASKMKLWLDIKNGALGRKAKPGISPFDVSGELYEQLTIEVNISVNIGRQSVEISIIDNGIGMEQECIDSLSIVGRGWKGRSLYRDETQKMPEWLRPTGGFGIGLQSVFMLANEVEICTRSAQEPGGHTLNIYAPNEKKPIAIHDNKRYNVGTVIKFKVLLDRFYALISREPELNLNEHKEFNLNFPKKMENAFERKSAEEYIMQYMHYYLVKTFPDTLLPIKLTCDGRSPILIKSRYASEKGGFSNQITSWDGSSHPKQWDEKRFYYVSNDLTVRIWDKEYNAFVCVSVWSDFIRTGDEKSRYLRVLDSSERRLLNAVCYKNARVRHPDDSDDYLNWFDFLAVCIDFMGWNTADVLPIQRSSFTEGFDVAFYYRKYVALALKIIHKEYQDKMPVGNLPMFYYLLAVIQLLDESEATKIIDDFHGQVMFPKQVQIKLIGENFCIEKTQMDTETALKEIARIFRGESNPVTGSRNVFVAAQETVSEDKITSFPMDILQIDPAFNYLPEGLQKARNLADELVKTGVIYEDRYICNALLRKGRRLDKEYFRITNEEHTDEILPTYVMIADLAGDSIEYMPQKEIGYKEFLIKCFRANHGRYIAKNEASGNPDYEKLKVKMLPGRKQDETDARKNMYFISPINHIAHRKILELAEIDEKYVDFSNPKVKMNKKVSKSKFIKTVIKDRWYDGIVSWVLEYQIGDSTGKKLSREEINKSYRNLLSDIYDNIMETGESNA